MRGKVVNRIHQWSKFCQGPAPTYQICQARQMAFPRLRDRYLYVTDLRAYRKLKR